MEELFIKIENSEILETIDNLNLNNRLITTKEGKFIVKIDYEPLIQTPSEFENINTKEEISKSSELFQTQDSLHQAAPISSDSEPSLKVINKKTVNNSCSRKSLFNTKNKQKNHRKKCICDVCQRTFASKRTIKGHLSNFHGSIKCLFCPQTFASEKFQKKHIIFTHIERKIKCSLCPKKFISIQYLNLHMHHHENERLAILSKTSKDITVYKCEICQRNYYDIFIFRRHERCHKNRRTIKKIFKCEVCDESFKHSRYLISHKRIHDDNTLSFDCDICKKKFTRKSSLRLHVESHTDQRKYACQLCTKTYKLAKGLTRHMHKHNLHKYNPDVKNKYVMNSLGKYECEECQTILSSSGTLRRHLLTHYGNKKNACPFCGKEFFRKGDLDVHIRMHTGEKPFSCSKCGKKFAHLGNMRKHEKKDH